MEKNDFVYNNVISTGAIALWDSEKPCIVSPSYTVFSLNNTDLLSKYLLLWLKRKEFLRSTLFYAVGTVKDNFDFSLMEEVEIPIPSIETQQSIVNIFDVYNNRKNIIQKLLKLTKDICPILIRGAIQEAKRK